MATKLRLDCCAIGSCLGLSCTVAQDKSGIPAREKIALMTAAHEEQFTLNALAVDGLGQNEDASVPGAHSRVRGRTGGRSPLGD